ncbi:hypothetical protein SAMN05216480_11473 [Pustulibacterium marinum]|uniref:Uncharacterized protein n=1 Tax=Pustulibacterium marinum TaxID=1224947 RepID=A0A1I7IBN3_9FLAO|nr:hypothetical protein SAMN05216480_11473 [Pustulibacterium marinum]
MKIRLNALASDIIISVYVAVTLLLRVNYETQITVDPLTSILIGLSFMIILWVFIKLKVLNPNWFGLFKYKQSSS